MEKMTVLNGGLSNSLNNMNNLGITPHYVPPVQYPIQKQDMPFEIIHVKEGDVLFNEGEQARGLYYVQSGCIKMVVNRRQSRGRTTSPEYVTKLVGAGEYFGYKALVRGTPSTAMAKAIKPTVLWLYPRELVSVAIGQTNPLLKLVLEQAVSDIENFESTSQLHYLASVQERIAYQLVLMADKFGVETPHGISLNLKLTRNEFAQLASTINESLSRHLTEFKNEGLIELNGKEILIKNKEGLMKKSGNFQLKS
jgi:CRP-like cAMP-binding protein